MKIEVRNVTKAYGAFHALRDVSVEVPDGQLVALLGPSGSGKNHPPAHHRGLEEADGAKYFIRKMMSRGVLCASAMSVLSFSIMRCFRI
jgi:ABC-type sulfate/molybdate transport systems ATPase subunit